MSKKYQNIYNLLCQDIKNNVFRDGDKLPSESEMMEAYNVGRQTVRRVLALLEEEGLIRKVRGSGSFVQIKRPFLDTKRIAVIFFNIKTSVFPIIMQRIDDALYLNGYTTSFYSTGGSLQKERFILQQMIDSPVDGIVMHATYAPLCTNMDLIRELQSLGTKILFLESWYANTELAQVPTVSVENYDGPYKITEYLIRHGHKRIGGFSISASLSHIARYAGICNALLRNQVEFNTEWFFNVAYNDDASLIKSRLAVDVLHSLDAFICPSATLIEPLLEFLKQYGCGNIRTVVIFDEVSVPSIDGVEFIILQHPSLKLAQICAEAILALINGQEVSSVQIPWMLSALSTAKELPDAFPKPEPG